MATSDHLTDPSILLHPLFSTPSHDSSSIHSNTTTTTSSDVSPSSSFHDAPKHTHKYRRVSSGKVTKKQRKSLSTKGSNTTFINVDPSSFRQMVQQVTGSSLCHNHALRTPRPDPYRPGNHHLSAVGNDISNGSMECLPTLDTSAFLLELHRDEEQSRTAEPAGQGSVDTVGLTWWDDLELLGMGSFPTLDSFY